MITRLRPRPDPMAHSIRQSQKMAEEQGFASVSSSWFATTNPLSDYIEELERTAPSRQTVDVAYTDLSPTIAHGRFALAVGDRLLYPDEHAAGQLGSLVGTGSYYPSKLVKRGTPEAADALLYAISRAQTPDHEVITLRVDGSTIQGIAPRSKSVIDHAWLIRLLARVIPDARTSHWYGDGWGVVGNLLVPDTICQQDDGDYGALVHCSNCELGRYSSSVRPSLFRAICQNGCIWGVTRGRTLALTRLTLTELEAVITKTVHDSIGISKNAIAALLLTRNLTTNANMKPVFAEIARQNRLRVDIATKVLNAWWLERKQLPDLDHTLFSVINAITRAAHSQPDLALQVRLEELGGRLAQIGKDGWDDLLHRAAQLTAKQVDAKFNWSLAG